MTYAPGRRCSVARGRRREDDAVVRPRGPGLPSLCSLRPRRDDHDNPTTGGPFPRGHRGPFQVAISNRELPHRRLEKSVAARELEPSVSTTRGQRDVSASCAADAAGEAARKRSLQLIEPAEATTAQCLHTTGGRTPEALLAVLGGWRQLALANPVTPRAAGVRRERRQPSGARNRDAGRRNVHVAGSDSRLRYAAIGQAHLAELGVEAARETTRILGRLRPRGLNDPRGRIRPRQEHTENRDPPDLGPRDPREPRAVSPTRISTSP